MAYGKWKGPEGSGKEKGRGETAFSDRCLTSPFLNRG